MPNFDKNTGIYTFLDMYEVAIYGASDTKKASYLLLNLNPRKYAIILPNL